MAFAHCHKCGWEQDDFWSEGYNPFKSLQDWVPHLLEFDKLETRFPSDNKRDNRTWREVLAQQCEDAARSIRMMHYMTFEDAVGSPCPRCGNKVCID